MDLRKTLLAATTVVVLSAPQLFADEAKIEKGKKVKFDYTLKVDGAVVETSEGKQPLEYTHGEGQIIEGLSSQIEGMKVGEQKVVTVTPDKGYGEIKKELYTEFEKKMFPEDFKPEIGQAFSMVNPEGQQMVGIVTEIKENSYMFSFNHPLAGKTLEFDVKIVSIE